MTTIACDGKTMASDSRQIGSYIDPVTAVKIREFNNCLIGNAGDPAILGTFIHWLREGCDKSKKPDIQENEFLMLKDGEIYHYSKELNPIPVGNPAAIGSGAKFAMTAMLCGKTPTEAVEIACQLDPYSGGEIQEFKLPR